MTKEEINSAALEAFPVIMMYGGGQPAYDTNKEKREAFVKGFEFKQWLQDTNMIRPNYKPPLYIKFRMFKNQTT